MPNTGHHWTEDEDRAALAGWPDYNGFCLILGHDNITYHAFRHRVRYLSTLTRPVSRWGRFKLWLRSFGL